MTRIQLERKYNIVIITATIQRKNWYSFYSPDGKLHKGLFSTLKDVDEECKKLYVDKVNLSEYN